MNGIEANTVGHRAAKPPLGAQGDAGMASSADVIDAPLVRRPGVTAMGLAALGVVFGDIGTSPLYTLKTVLDTDRRASRRRRRRSGRCR